jgi:hypothetical protein
MRGRMSFTAITGAIGAIRAAYKFFTSPTGKYIGLALLLLASHGYVYTKGDANGAERIRDEWKAAVVAAAKQQVAAREAAERANPPLVAVPTPVVPANCPDTTPRARNDGVLVNDANNRSRQRRR